MNKSKKLEASIQALDYLLSKYETLPILGVGSGETMDIFISELAKYKDRISELVSSSNQTNASLNTYKLTDKLLKSAQVTDVEIYLDSPDNINSRQQLLKGKSGCLTKEKIIAYNAKKFYCIIDSTKKIDEFDTPIAIEVLPFARTIVAKKIIKLGGIPKYRDNYLTDNGNMILDTYNLPTSNPIQMENKIKSISGVIESGIFAIRTPDKVFCV